MRLEIYGTDFVNFVHGNKLTLFGHQVPQKTQTTNDTFHHNKIFPILLDLTVHERQGMEICRVPQYYLLQENYGSDRNLMYSSISKQNEAPRLS